MTSLNNLMIQRDQLDKKIKECEQTIQSAPEGDLIARKLPSGKYGYSKKIHLPNGTIKEIYLGVGDSPEARSLAEKRYAKKILPALKAEKALLDKLTALRAKEPDSDLFLKKHPGFCPLLQVTKENEDLDSWKHASYNRNSNYSDQLIFSTVVPGLMVRSKSEADIVSRLEHYRVPYHYEEILMINHVPVAVDFTCRNLTTKQVLYWDHRGMLDNPSYIQKTLNNDALYLNAGIIPGITLIITTETKACPLDIQWVDILIQHYLL